MGSSADGWRSTSTWRRGGNGRGRRRGGVPPARREQLLAIAGGLNVPAAFVGRAGGERLRLWSLDLSLAELRDAYEGGLGRALGGQGARPPPPLPWGGGAAKLRDGGG